MSWPRWRWPPQSLIREGSCVCDAGDGTWPGCSDTQTMYANS